MADLDPVQYGTNEPRRLSAPLILGVIAIPLVFGWLLLRPGYSPAFRQGALSLGLFSLIAAVGDAMGG